MQLRRAVGQRFLDLEYGRQLLVLDLDQVDCLLRDVLIVGGYGSNAFADEAHAVGREHRDVLDRAAVELGLDIGGGEHGMHAGQRASRGYVDADDARVGVRRVQRLAVKCARQCVVGSVAGLAGDLVDAVRSLLCVSNDSIRRDQGVPPACSRKASLSEVERIICGVSWRTEAPTTT